MLGEQQRKSLFGFLQLLENMFSTTFDMDIIDHLEVVAQITISTGTGFSSFISGNLIQMIDTFSKNG